MVRVRIGLALWVGTILGGRVAHARTNVQRDVEGYAIATCLSEQPVAYLKDQGDAWASVVVQRSPANIQLFQPVQDAVEAELKKGHAAAIYDEKDPHRSKPVPVLYCAEIIDEPLVREAIDKAIKKLERVYRPAKK
jgi:hypothetical protein